MGTSRKKGARWNRGTHFIIEGEHFASVGHAYSVAKGTHGCPCSESTFSARLRKSSGVKTWANLCRPIQEKISAARKKSDKSKHDEMAEIIKRLDARKKQI